MKSQLMTSIVVHSFTSFSTPVIQFRGISGCPARWFIVIVLRGTRSIILYELCFKSHNVRKLSLVFYATCWILCFRLKFHFVNKRAIGGRRSESTFNRLFDWIRQDLFHHCQSWLHRGGIFTLDLWWFKMMWLLRSVRCRGQSAGWLCTSHWLIMNHLNECCRLLSVISAEETFCMWEQIVIRWL